MNRVLIFAMLFLTPIYAADDWGPIQFLIGHWIGQGNGQPGQGNGSFSLIPDLQGKVLLRKSYAEYPPSNGKPAVRHDDLMVVYREERDGVRQLRADYFDSEDHVIRYAVKPSEGGVVFVTETAPTTMRFRLTYTAAGADRVKLKFEIAPPGKDFSAYLEGTVRRDQAK